MSVRCASSWSCRWVSCREIMSSPTVRKVSSAARRSAISIEVSSMRLSVSSASTARNLAVNCRSWAMCHALSSRCIFCRRWARFRPSTPRHTRCRCPAALVWILMRRRCHVVKYVAHNSARRAASRPASFSLACSSYCSKTQSSLFFPRAATAAQAPASARISRSRCAFSAFPTIARCRTPTSWRYWSPKRAKTSRSSCCMACLASASST
mmetsp:Transcript_77769/g.137103  ORF Transcript_77769/g.137103 Transcript_77769/m.137103 type:complete len:210 (+) Transcript_77769:2124-2753(+)